MDAVKTFDVIVIGSGSGAIVADRANWQGLKTALVDRGPLGGTCLNVGCIPSKMLIYPADRLIEAQEASRLGVRVRVEGVDFEGILRRTRDLVRQSQEEIRHALSDSGVTYIEAQCTFVADYTLEVGGERIRGEKVFIAAGARPIIPAIPGLDQVGYLTNESLLGLEQPPESLIIIGGGFIGCEYAHFFSAMGARVTLLQMEHSLIPDEEPEFGIILKRRLSQRLDVRTDTQAIEVRAEGEGVVVVAKNALTGRRSEFGAQRLLLAVGRRSNADTLNVEATGVRTTPQGFIEANDYLECSKANIWAFGDAIGKHMFTHVANQEALVAWHNASHSEHKVKMDYRAAPHAIFSYPPVASVGLTEAQARGRFRYLVGKASYRQVARGQAMMDTDGMAKAIVEKDGGHLLGFHVIGPGAELLIQEVIGVMANEGSVRNITAAMHIHPALPEVVMAALQSLREPEKARGAGA